MKEKLVVIGNGMAGMRTVEELLDIAPEKYDITVIGAEPYGNYNRIMLSPVLCGEKNIDEIMLNDEQWYIDNNVTLLKGAKVTNVDRSACTVTADDGTSVNYDRLLVATGSDPFIIPIPGHDLPGVIGFRDIKDVNDMIETSKTKNRAVVIGGGLLGLEAANGLMKQGMDVTVIHLMDWLMERQMDDISGGMLKKSLEDQGMIFRMKTSTSEIKGDGKVETIVFADGSEIDTDLIVMAVGIRPNIELGKQIGLKCERGIVVDDTLKTNDEKIFAIGECIEHRGNVYGLVAPLFEMAKVCAKHLAGESDSIYEPA